MHGGNMNMTFRVSDEVRDELDGAASEIGMTASQLTRIAVLDVIEKVRECRDNPDKLQELTRLAAKAHALAA